LASSSNAALLDDLPPELAKLTGHLVQKWWVQHGLPEASQRLQKEPKVIISTLTPYNVLVFYVLILI
jgi:hypothetical protein